MSQVRSTDGTSIAFERSGNGPALILVDGAFCSRAFGPSPKLAPILARHFTVYTYDRRGRGQSGDTLPYSPEREVEDLAALSGERVGRHCCSACPQAGRWLSKLRPLESRLRGWSHTNRPTWMTVRLAQRSTRLNSRVCLPRAIAAPR
jgi:hypothetical protein